MVFNDSTTGDGDEKIGGTCNKVVVSTIDMALLAMMNNAFDITNLLETAARLDS